jgi:hypothetical protein
MRRRGASEVPASRGGILAHNSFPHSDFGAISAAVPRARETTSLAFSINSSTYL